MSRVRSNLPPDHEPALRQVREDIPAPPSAPSRKVRLQEPAGPDSEPARRHRLSAEGLIEGDDDALVLTDSGELLLLQAVEKLQTNQPAPRPHWDSVGRVLLWQGTVVKRLKREAEAQETVLVAFESHDWPERIDDPLELEPGLNPKERLRETVKSLNRNRECQLVRFHADGTGRGIRWTAQT